MSGEAKNTAEERNESKGECDGGQERASVLDGQANGHQWDKNQD